MAYRIPEPTDTGESPQDWVKLIYKNNVLVSDIIIGNAKNADNNMVPTGVEKGTVIVVNHAAFIFKGDELIDDFDSLEISDKNRAIIYAMATGDIVDLFFSNEQPTFQPEKGGWYHPALNARACWYFYRTGESACMSKTQFRSEKGINEGSASDIIGLDTSEFFYTFQMSNGSISWALNIAQNSKIDDGEKIVEVPANKTIPMFDFTKYQYIEIDKNGNFIPSNAEGELNTAKNAKFNKVSGNRILNKSTKDLTFLNILGNSSDLVSMYHDGKTLFYLTSGSRYLFDDAYTYTQISMPVIYQRYLVSWKYGWAAITYINSSGTITYGVSISPDGVTWAPVLSGLTALPEFINSIWIGNLSNYTQNISFNAWEADLLFIFTSSTQLYIIGPDGTMKQAAGSITDLYSSYKTVYRPIFLNKCQGYYLLNGNNSRGDGKNTFIIPLSFDSVALLDISLLPPLYSIANTVTTVCSDGNLMWYSMGTIIYYSSSLNGSVPVLIRSAVNDLTDLTDGNNIRIYPTGIIGLIDKGRKIVVFASGISYNRYELVHLGNDNWMFNHIQGPVGTYTNYFFSDRYNYVYQIFKSNNYADIRYTFNGNDWYRVILADNNPNGYLQIYIITDYTYKDVGEKLYVISDTTTGIYLSIYEKDQLVYRATVQTSSFRLFYGELVAVTPSIRLEFAVPDFTTMYDPKINKYIKTGGNSSNIRLIHFQGVEIDND